MANLKSKKALLYAFVTVLIAVAAVFAMGITASAEVYNISDGSVTISADGTYLIYGDNTATTNTITVSSGINADITLDGVNINVSSTSGACAFKIENGSTGNVTITLADGSTNTLTSGNGCAGLQKSGTSGSLEIKGTGILNATGGSSGAGIGGGAYGQGSNITISGGTVIATGGNGGAGIGGGSGTMSGGEGSDITISGGTVTAKGGDYGAGIGGGYKGTGSAITISGGSVKAVAGTNANAIGGGGGADAVTPTNADDDDVYLVTIANPNNEAVYIDGSATAYVPSNHTAADSTDTNLYVYLTSTENHTVMAGSVQYDYTFDNTAGEFVLNEGTDLTITGTDLVYGVDYAYPASTGVLTILSDKAITIANASGVATTDDTIFVADGVSANITLAGVNINASGAAFKIEDNSTGNVTITLADGLTNTLTSGANCAGLQKNGEKGSLEIKGTGALTAIGGECGAGIGGGASATGYITISGGTVIATGGANSAGIGGGGKQTMSSGWYGTNITISGGTVTAKGGDYGAGIGGGHYSNGSGITISGGTVNATGGNRGAGIGGGGYYNSFDSGGNGINITISGGTVTATGGNNGAGIGSGCGNSNSGNIVINGGSVKAVAGLNANAIGGGANCDAVTPTNVTSNWATAENVYLLTIANTSGGAVTIDGKDYPVSHGTETTVYAYLTEGVHSITVDGVTTNYTYVKNTDNTLVAIGSDLTITGTDLVYGEDYTYPADTGVLTIYSDKAITIANASDVATTTDRIFVVKDNNADITLAGVNIVLTGSGSPLWIADNSTGAVKITLAADTENILQCSTTSGYTFAAIQKNGTYGSLEITGAGSLDVQGGYNAAGIGSSKDNSTANITISGGTVNARGYSGGAGIGAGENGSATNIEISGGVVTASGAYNGAGIGGGSQGSASDITISGGVVTATGGSNDGAAIGSGYSGSCTDTIVITGGSVKTESYSNKFGSSTAVIPTDGNGNNVYLLEIENTENADIKIGVKDYPDKHLDEEKIYAYLPAKTVDAPNEVVTDETTYYHYDTTEDKWYRIITAPTALTGDSAKFTYNGSEQTYTLAANADYYTISGNKQTNAGTHTVTVTPKDDVMWSDSTTAAQTFDFVIAKAAVTITAKSYTIKVGETLPTYTYDVTGLVNGETLPITVNVSCTADGKTAGTFDIIVSGADESTNYTFSYTSGTLTITAKEIQTITASDVTLTYGETGKITATTSGDGAISYAVTSDVISVAADGTITAHKGGTATVTITAAETDTYAVATRTVTVTVNKAAVTIAADDITIYVGEIPELTATVSGIVDGDEVELSYSVGCGYDDKVGTYEITVDLAPIEDERYTFTAQNGTLTIKKKSSGGGGGGTGGGGSYTPSTPQNPELNDKSMSWATMVTEIAKLTAGSNATIKLNDNYDVPADVIKALADKDIKATFIVDSTRNWYVDGKNIEAFAAADLRVTTIAMLDCSALRGTVGTRFRIDDTNAPTELTITFAKVNAGKFANLYKKDGDELVFVDNVKVDENGNAKLLDVTDKGDYVVMLCEYSDRKGDVNNDGIVNALDASAVLRDIVELEAAANPEMRDYNGDGRVNALDASAILIDIVNDRV